MAAHLWMKANAAIVLVVRAYRYLCPLCNHLNLENKAVPLAVCQGCSAVMRVREVCFSDRDNALTPGTPPEKLTQALLFRQPCAEVDIIAVGYLWACGECDPYGEKPHLRASLADHLICPRCRATFPVLEICHRLSPELRAKTLLRSALSVIPATRKNNQPGPPLSFEEWSFFETKGEN